MSDSDLFENLKRGQRKAQEHFYNKFSGKVLAICRRYLADPYEAEDAMIQILLKALEHIADLKNESSMEAWIRRISVNHCLNQLKSTLTFKIIPISYLTDEDSDLPQIEFETDYLLQLISELPPGYRTVFNLFAIEGYSHREIAEMLGISENTSKSQLSRARVLLQKKLQSKSQKNISNEQN